MEGSQIIGFIAIIGSKSPTRADLLAIWKCLHLAWGKGFQKIIFESDLKVGKLIRESSPLDPHFSLISCTRSFMEYNWLCDLGFIRL